MGEGRFRFGCSCGSVLLQCGVGSVVWAVWCGQCGVGVVRPVCCCSMMLQCGASVVQAVWCCSVMLHLHMLEMVSVLVLNPLRFLAGIIVHDGRRDAGAVRIHRVQSPMLVQLWHWWLHDNSCTFSGSTSPVVHALAA